MSEITNPIPMKQRKKSIFTRWWFWLLVVVIVLFAAFAVIGSQGSGTAYELSKMQLMSKKQIIAKFGKPDEVLFDGPKGYDYAYNEGFTVQGTSKGAEEVVLSRTMVKKKTRNSYKIFNVYLTSSMAATLKRLGTPDYTTKKNGIKTIAYLTNEGDVLRIASRYNSDHIDVIDYSTYDMSTMRYALNVNRLLGQTMTEAQIQKTYTIQSKSTPRKNETQYILNGFAMALNHRNHQIQEVWIPKNKAYNFQGVRIGDILPKANQVFGKFRSSRTGVKNTTQYIYNYNNGRYPLRVLVTLNNTSKKIEYLDAKIDASAHKL